MNCISPISLKDPRKIAGGLRMTVPCGKCGACKHNNRTGWSFRLKEELKTAITAIFVTLTYDQENIKYDIKSRKQTLIKTDLQKFNKRLRKANAKIWNHQMRYYAVGEYGTETKRPHYHIILFNVAPKLQNDITKIWGMGQTHQGEVNDKTIHYTTKYHVNYDKKDTTRNPEFAVMSRRPAIGYNYLERVGKKWHHDNGNTYVINNGFAQSMPRYYKDKIFTNPWQKLYLQRAAMKEQDKQHIKEAIRLTKLGKTNPEYEIQNRAYQAALKVEKKAKENNKI